MRIAYFINEYPKVSHTFIRREILALERRGVTVERYSLRGNRDSLPDATDRAEFDQTRFVLKASAPEIFRGLAATALRAPLKTLKTLGRAVRTGLESRRGVMPQLAYFVEAAVLRTWWSEADIHHVHAHFGTNPAAVVMFCRMLGGPDYSLTIHGSEEFDRPEELVLSDKIRGARFVATVSSFGRGQVLRWADEGDWPKVHVVRCGLDPEYFDAVDRTSGQRPRILCIGRLSKEKGQIFLVRAVYGLKNRGADFEVVLAGDGPLRSNVEAEIEELGLQDRITITGWIDNAKIRELLAGTHTLVVPSLAEGLPIVIMEAFAMKVPVISSALAGIPELVEDGKSGWLVPTSDVEALVEALESSLSMGSSERAAMAERGYRRVRDMHSADREADRLFRLLEQAGAFGGER